MAACIFCGRTGATIKITREHTFPNWVNQVLTTTVVGPNITYERTIQHGSRPETVQTWPAQMVADHTLREVCEHCNNGWMAKSESATAPLITPMIKGEPAHMTVDEQLTVATWAVMKATVFEYVWSVDPILTADDRGIIMTQNRPPATVQVRLAAVESNGTPLRAQAIRYERRGTGEEVICLTIAIGCLVVQVVGGPGVGTRGLLTTGAAGADYIAIFPPAMSAVHWPPASVLDDQSLVAFANPLASGT